jgi:hypothetical protein
MNLPIETRPIDLKIFIGRRSGLADRAAGVSAPMEAGTKLPTPVIPLVGPSRAIKESRMAYAHRVAANIIWLLIVDIISN